MKHSLFARTVLINQKSDVSSTSKAEDFEHAHYKNTTKDQNGIKADMDRQQEVQYSSYIL